MPRFGPLEQNPGKKTQNGAHARAQRGLGCERGPTSMQSQQTCAHACTERNPTCGHAGTTQANMAQCIGTQAHGACPWSSEPHFTRSTWTFHAIHENWHSPGSFYRGLQLNFVWSDNSARPWTRSDDRGHFNMIQVWPSRILIHLLTIEWLTTFKESNNNCTRTYKPFFDTVWTSRVLSKCSSTGRPIYGPSIYKRDKESEKVW